MQRNVPYGYELRPAHKRNTSARGAILHFRDKSGQLLVLQRIVRKIIMYPGFDCRRTTAVLRTVLTSRFVGVSAQKASGPILDEQESR